MSETSAAKQDRIEAERERRCLRCGQQAADRPRGCKGGKCSNCGHPYPLGDCSD
jgi:hypothetical protein